ncbi:MAG: nicotinate-nucleotide--dimethylbenzimidazole phosphoribosyltransferase [Hyphomicrobiales bacterium]|jgi:nicotinate-nucleotide--dimethylbenzimidazole phosphoribosyltransferase|nr:nicotinate-nucleotide--dimethylbenzimidazole phosphoribosyltransferase [Hyphomicrobiales bacterium]
MTTGLPFDDFRFLLDNLPEADQSQAEKVRAVFERAGIAGSLAPLAELAAWLAAWTGRPPAVTRPLVAIFAGNHGVARRGVSPRPMSATAAMVEMCAAGGAAVNQVCVANDLGLKVFDLALDLPTADIAEEAALDERGCAATMAFGMEAIVGGTDLICLSDVGVGNDTVAAAMFAALYGGEGIEWVGHPDANDAVLARMAASVDEALALHRSHLKDPLEVLRRVGGREIAAIAGGILAARMEKVPVLIDGFASSAAAAVLHALNPRALDHCRLSSLSYQQSHRCVAEKLGLKPLLDFELDEPGVGAGVAAGIVKAAALTASGLATAVGQGTKSA